MRDHFKQVKISAGELDERDFLDRVDILRNLMAEGYSKEILKKIQEGKSK
ncbi:hypothetical protein [Bacteroidetes bacterium endosymbiont of Geopemphigus sp.]|nr:hypothetical protein [Bacteroidetes bacterium endosymbiont of Geopemphigus sp.]